MQATYSIGSAAKIQCCFYTNYRFPFYIVFDGGASGVLNKIFTQAENQGLAAEVSDSAMGVVIMFSNKHAAIRDRLAIEVIQHS